MNKPRLSFPAIWNMSFGFLGIQFGWGLQMANMSSIYQYLGAKPEELALLWLAAPLTGLVLQPIVGYFSDRTWNRLGRRRPYFLAGALCASTALVLMPHSSALWMAVGLLWILDASVNLSMEPFRAFVADKLPEEQHSAGFAMQSVLIGFGAVVSSSLPWMLMNWFGMSFESGGESAIPAAVKLSFYIGSGVFLAAVLYTIVTTPEYPPEDIGSFRRQNAATAGLSHALREILTGIQTMPKTMRQLAVVQFFTWIAFFAMWIYFGTGIAERIFQGTPGTQPYAEGVAWGGVCFSAYNGIAFVFAFVLLWLVRHFRAKDIHTFCLLAGGISMASVPFLPHPHLLLAAMAGVGVAWASILAMPYAMLAASLPPEKTGFYMGVFNFFIVIPQIIMSLFLGEMIVKLGAGNQLAPVFVGGISLLIAAGLTRFVEEKPISQ